MKQTEEKEISGQSVKNLLPQVTYFSEGGKSFGDRGWFPPQICSPRSVTPFLTFFLLGSAAQVFQG